MPNDPKTAFSPGPPIPPIGFPRLPFDKPSLSPGNFGPGSAGNVRFPSTTIGSGVGPGASMGLGGATGGASLGGIGPVAVVGVGTLTIGGATLVSTLGTLPAVAPLTIPKLPPLTSARIGGASLLGASATKVIEAAEAAKTLTLGTQAAVALQAAVAAKVLEQVEKRGTEKCPCPGMTDSLGRRCGGRAAFYRRRGLKPTCSGVKSEIGEKYALWLSPKEKERVYSIPLGIEREIVNLKAGDVPSIIEKLSPWGGGGKSVKFPSLPYDPSLDTEKLGNFYNRLQR